MVIKKKKKIEAKQLYKWTLMEKNIYHMTLFKVLFLHP